MKALIVEDDPVIHDTLKELLHHWGLHRLVVCRRLPYSANRESTVRSNPSAIRFSACFASPVMLLTNYGIPSPLSAL